MGDIKTFVEGAWNHREHHQSPEHEAVLSALARQRDSLSQDERGHAEFYLKWAVLDGAARTESYLSAAAKNVDGSAAACRLVDEEQFTAEISWMKRLAEQRRLTPKLDSWLARQRHVFVDSFRSDPRLMAGMNGWRDLRTDKRRDFLASVARRRIETLSDRQPGLTPPAVEFYHDGGGLEMGSASGTRNEINLNSAILNSEDASQALMVVYHEGTHNILTQLAEAVGRKRIPPSHTLYDDARTLEFARHFGLAAPAEIQSIHASDAEEKLAFREQEYFLYNLRHGHGLRAKFDVVRFVAGRYLDRDSQKPTLRALLQDLRFG